MKFKFDLQILRIIIILIIGVLFFTSILHLVAILYPENYISEITKSLFFNNYFPDRSFSYPDEGYKIYMIGNSIILAYLAYNLIKAFKIIHNTLQNKIFYKSQATDIVKIADSIIIFAQLKFLLILLCGSFLLIAPFNVISFIPTFVVLYILGKILIFFGEFAKKGQALKEDIDLTI